MSDEGWVTDKDAIFTLFKLRGPQQGDVLQCRFSPNNGWNGTIMEVARVDDNDKELCYVNVLSTTYTSYRPEMNGKYNWYSDVAEIERWKPYVPKT